MLATYSVSPVFGNAGPWEKVLKGKNPQHQIHLKVEQLKENYYQADCFISSDGKLFPAGSSRSKFEVVKDWMSRKVKAIVDDSDKGAIDELFESISKTK